MRKRLFLKVVLFFNVEKFRIEKKGKNMELRTLGIDEGLKINEEVSFAMKTLPLESLRTAPNRHACIKAWQEKKIVSGKSHLELTENDSIAINTLVAVAIVNLEWCNDPKEKLATEDVLSAILIDLNDEDSKRLISLLLRKILKEKKVSLEPGSNWGYVNSLFDSILPDELYLPGWREVIGVLENTSVNQQTIEAIVKKVIYEKPHFIEDFKWPKNSKCFSRGDNDTLKNVVGNIKTYAEDWQIIKGWIGDIFGFETELYNELEEKISEHRKNVMEYFFEKEMFQGGGVVSKTFKVAYAYWQDELKEEKVKGYFREFLEKDGLDSSLSNWFSVLIGLTNAIPEITEVKNRDVLLKSCVQVNENDDSAKISINMNKAIKGFLLKIIDDYEINGKSWLLNESYPLLKDISNAIRNLQEAQKEFEKVLFDEGEQSRRLPNLIAKKDYFSDEIKVLCHKFCESCLQLFSLKDELSPMLEKGLMYEDSFNIKEKNGDIEITYVIDTNVRYATMFKEIFESTLNWPLEREMRKKHIEALVDSHTVKVEVENVNVSKMKLRKF